MERLFLVLAVVLAGLISKSVHAAEISKINYACFLNGEEGETDSCPFPKKDILVHGPIDVGDGKKFEILVRAIGRGVDKVVLRTPGGSVSDAIEMGRLIRRLMVGTQGPLFSQSGERHCGSGEKTPAQNCVCASACFLVYAGGFPREVSHVLLHRPYIKPSVNASMQYDESLKVMGASKKQVADFLRDMQIPGKYAELMFQTPSNEAAEISYSDMRDVLSGFPPDAEEWLAAKCMTKSAGQSLRHYQEKLSAADNVDEMKVAQSNHFSDEYKRLKCTDEALKQKRDSVREAWFGPVTAAERAKDQEFRQKSDEALIRHLKHLGLYPPASPTK